MPQAVTARAGHTIMIGGMAPDKFGAVLDAFGPLPEKSQHELAERLVGAVAVYRLRIMTKGPQPAEERRQLERIARLAGELLECMSVGDPHRSGEIQPRTATGARLVVELHRVSNDRRPATSTHGAWERWTTLVLLLSELKEAAKQSQRSLRVSKRRGRGGKSRAGPAPKEELLHRLSETYAALRLSFPESGPPLACDKKLRAFVRAGLVLAASSAPPMTGADGVEYEYALKACGRDLSQASETTDAAIRLAFRRWKHIPKRDTFDLSLALGNRPT